MACVDLFGEMLDREHACCVRTGGAGVEGNDGETFSSNEKVD
jgi:hypothetical protein